MPSYGVPQLLMVSHESSVVGSYTPQCLVHAEKRTISIIARAVHARNAFSDNVGFNLNSYRARWDLLDLAISDEFGEQLP